MRGVLAQEPRAAADYVEVVREETFEPAVQLRGTCYALLAVFFGTTRLLDNMLIEEQDGRFHCTL